MTIVALTETCIPGCAAPRRDLTSDALSNVIASCCLKLAGALVAAEGGLVTAFPLNACACSCAARAMVRRLFYFIGAYVILGRRSPLETVLWV